MESILDTARTLLTGDWGPIIGAVIALALANRPVLAAAFNALLSRLKTPATPTPSPAPVPLSDPLLPGDHPLLNAAIDQLRRWLLSRVTATSDRPAVSDPATEAKRVLSWIPNGPDPK